jgi:hypothetical protein
MIRRRSILTLSAIAAMMFWSAIAFAHNGIEHVMGTVTAKSDVSITVETLKHTTVTVMVDRSTTFTHTDAKASIEDLKIGERVAIDAKERADKKLQGVSVRWGARSSGTAGHADRKLVPGSH